MAEFDVYASRSQGVGQWTFTGREKPRVDTSSIEHTDVVDQSARRSGVGLASGEVVQHTKRSHWLIREAGDAAIGSPPTFRCATRDDERS